ncbi:MAG: ATP-binding protein [Candidatus Omnitrophica bacterium]|nr:ATP-binding protein [Candidatus Omnitrophota bacterium]
MIPRIYQNLEEYLEPGKVLVLYGPRQVGKTTLLEHFLSRVSLKYRLDTGDDMRIKDLFLSRSLDKLLDYAGGYELVAIDEAQKVLYIGEGLKMLVDKRPSLKIIVTGSSSFSLSGQIGEPLTGRKNTLVLFPISLLELRGIYNNYELEKKLEDFLVFGLYPEVLTAEDKKKRIRRIEEIAHSYLFKDILEMERIKNPRILTDLLRLLAFQIGKEVSFHELASSLSVDSKTIAKYIDLLEKTFIIFNVRGFSRNLRKEITKKSKYYFYDNGIRNALIANFNPLELRNDAGMLWENFVFIERMKKRNYKFMVSNVYFWRTWQKEEVDMVEERGGKLFGYEFKWSTKKKTLKPPRNWKESYPEASFEVITPDNYIDFIT